MSLKEFRGINDPVNIMGISALVTDYDEIQSNIDLGQIENDIVNRLKKTKKTKNAPEIFRHELDQVMKGIDGVKLYDDHEADAISMDMQNRFGGGGGSKHRSKDKQLRAIPRPSAPPRGSESEDDGDDGEDSDDEIKSTAAETDFGPPAAMRGQQSKQYEGWMSSRDSPYTQGGMSQPEGRHRMGQSSFARSEWYGKKTNEERAQDVITRVLGNNEQRYTLPGGGGIGSRGGYNDGVSSQDKELENMIAKEQEKDLKAMLIAQYDLLKTTLTEEGADLSRVPPVNEDSSLSVINAALRMLRYKNDLRRYVSIGEDIILFIAYGLESAFDGKTSYFGYYPCLEGWSSSIKPRIKRMRADTSSVVSSAMNNFNFGSFTRMMLELVPSAFLHSRTRQNQTKGEVNDAEWRDSIVKLDSFIVKD